MSNHELPFLCFSLRAHFVEWAHHMLSGDQGLWSLWCCVNSYPSQMLLTRQWQMCPFHSWRDWEFGCCMQPLPWPPAWRPTQCLEIDSCLIHGWVAWRSSECLVAQKILVWCGICQPWAPAVRRVEFRAWWNCRTDSNECCVGREAVSKKKNLVVGLSEVLHQEKGVWSWRNLGCSGCL